MKNKVLRNIVLVLGISFLIGLPAFAKNIVPISVQSFKTIPIFHMVKQWAEAYFKVNVNEEVIYPDRDYELNDEGIIKAEVAKEVIEKTSEGVIKALKNKDTGFLADYVHPLKGVRFTPYTTVSLENDLVFSQEGMKNFFEDKTYTWGYYDGSGEEIQLTPSDYYEQFVYSEDFINAPEIGYNEVLTSGNMVENQFEVYDNAIVVEYHIPEVNPEFSGLDWQSLRLVFEEYEGNWKLVGIIHNQWTI